MLSGGNIYIAADENVDIVGNKSVNIGGTTINIAAGSADGAVGGINIVATAYNTTGIKNAYTAKVLIEPDSILMAGAKIEMLAGTGSNENYAAIKIDPNSSDDYGIWMGSDKAIGLFSSADANTTGSSVKISTT